MGPPGTAALAKVGDVFVRSGAVDTVEAVFTAATTCADVKVVLAAAATPDDPMMTAAATNAPRNRDDIVMKSLNLLVDRNATIERHLRMKTTVPVSSQQKLSRRHGYVSNLWTA
jgi:hypothetical protein